MIICARCNTESPRGIRPYWADAGHLLCPRCCLAVASICDERGCWPVVPWAAEELNAPGDLVTSAEVAVDHRESNIDTKWELY